MNPDQKSDKKFFFLITALIILAVISSFLGGFFVHQLLYTNQVPVPTPTPSATVTPVPTGPDIEQITTKYPPGKHFYDEGFYVLTKDNPPVTIVLSASRLEQNGGTYLQNTRASYINGDVTARLVDSKNTNDSAIVTDKIVKKWQTTIDPSRVLREGSEIEFVLNQTDFQLATGPLTNEIAIRSLPGYTKFFSNGNGTLTFNGQIHPVHLLYYRLYSQNAVDIQFYTQPVGLTTDLVVFWDQSDNLYVIDKSQVDKPVNDYQTHQVGFVEDKSGTVSRSFNVRVTRDSLSPPDHYTFAIDNLGVVLTLNRVKSVNKAPNENYQWYQSLVTGTVQNSGQTLSGRGTVEYIHDLK